MMDIIDNMINIDTLLCDDCDNLQIDDDDNEEKEFDRPNNGQMTTIVNIRTKYIRPTFNNLEEWMEDENNVYLEVRKCTYEGKELLY